MGDRMYATEGDSGYAARLGSGWDGGLRQDIQAGRTGGAGPLSGDPWGAAVPPRPQGDDATVGVARRLQNRLDHHLWLLDRLAAEQRPESPDLPELLDTAARMRRDTESLLLLFGHEPDVQATGPQRLEEVMADAAGLAEEAHRIDVRPAPAATIASAAAVEFLHVLAELVDHTTDAHPGARLELVGRIESGGATVDVVIDGAARYDPEGTGGRRPAAVAEQLARRSRHGIELHHPLGGPPPTGSGVIASVHCAAAAVTVEAPAPTQPPVNGSNGYPLYANGPGPLGISERPARGLAGLEDSGLGASGFGAAGFGAAGFGTSGLGTSGLGTSGFGTSGFGSSDLGNSDRGASGLAGAGTGSDPDDDLDDDLGTDLDDGPHGGPGDRFREVWSSFGSGSTNGARYGNGAGIDHGNGTVNGGATASGSDYLPLDPPTSPAYTPSKSSQVDELFGPLLDLPVDPIDDRYATPIFEAIASAWFRESGESDDRGDTQGPLDWETPEDNEWREAAARAARTEPTPTTASGLPRRTPGTQLVPPPRSQEGRSNGGPGERRPDRVRDRLSTYQRGLRQGRHRAPGEDAPEPEDW